MTLSVSRLLDIGLNVDTSGLESFLSQIRDRLDGLQDRVADLEQKDSEAEDHDHSDLADSDHSHDDYASQYDLDELATKVDDLSSVDEDRVVELINDKAYDAVSDQVYDMVKDVVREDLDEKDFADRDHDHTGEYATTDSVDELESRVTDAENTLESVQQRLTTIEDGNTNAQGEVNFHDMAARIESLEADRSEHLRLIQDLQESSSGATRFFKLAVQMLDIVRESVGR